VIGHLRIPTYTEYHTDIIKLILFIVAHSCGWQLTFDELYSALADCTTFGSGSKVGAVRMGGWAASTAGTKACPGRPATRRWQGRRRSPSAGSAVNYGQLRSPVAATVRPVARVAPALVARSFRFAPGVLRRHCAGAGLPLPVPAALCLVCSEVASALAPRSHRVRLLLYEWCVAPALALCRPYPRDWRCELPGFGDAANKEGRMGEGGAQEVRGG